MEHKEENKHKESRKSSPNSNIIRISLKQISIEFIVLERSDWSHYLFVQKRVPWFVVLKLEFKYSVLVWNLIKNYIYWRNWEVINRFVRNAFGWLLLGVTLKSRKNVGVFGSFYKVVLM